MLPAPTTDDLAAFTGRDVETFSPFADEALAQAALALSIVTELDTMPEDSNSARLATYAILELADKIYLEQPFAAAKASPFSSETAGSYSYTRMVVQANKNGNLTGMFWWDLAVENLTRDDRSLVTSGTLARVALDEGVYRDTATGEDVVLGPADIRIPDSSSYGYDINADNSSRRP